MRHPHRAPLFQTLFSIARRRLRLTAAIAAAVAAISLCRGCSLGTNGVGVVARPFCVGEILADVAGAATGRSFCTGWALAADVAVAARSLGTGRALAVAGLGAEA